MADDSDILVAFCQEQWAQARHTEEQRATISNLIMLSASVIIGFIAQQQFAPKMLPLTILLIGLGLFGAFVTEKLYDRFFYHHAKVYYWQRRLNELHPDTNLSKLEDEAEEWYIRHRPRMSKVRLHYLWLVLHLTIALMGVILTVLIFL